jgi:hypothetical protein
MAEAIDRLPLPRRDANDESALGCTIVICPVTHELSQRVLRLGFRSDAGRPSAGEGAGPSFIAIDRCGIMRRTGEDPLPMDHEAVHERLVQAARALEFVHYGELAKTLGIDMDNPHFGAQVGRVLGEISTDEVANGRPMLSAIVVSKDDMLPGRGFFNLGHELNQVDPGEDEIGFAVRQIRRVHDTSASR